MEGVDAVEEEAGVFNCIVKRKEDEIMYHSFFQNYSNAIQLCRGVLGTLDEEDSAIPSEDGDVLSIGVRKFNFA